MFSEFKIACYVIIFVSNLGAVTNFFNIFIMACDRYTAVKFPITYRNKVSMKIITVVLGFLWGLVSAKTILEVTVLAEVKYSSE